MRANLATLGARGVRFVDPGAGYLACGWVGKGRLAEPDDIVEAAGSHPQAVRRAARPARRRDRRADLRGHRRRALYRQPIERQDGICGRRGSRSAAAPASSSFPVRRRCRRPPAWSWCACAAPSRCTRPCSGSALDADIVVMAAAVADYTPGTPRARKDREERRAARTRRWSERRHSRDARTGARRPPAPVLVGFAAESGDPVERGRQKLVRKGADLIVANDISRRGPGSTRSSTPRPSSAATPSSRSPSARRPRSPRDPRPRRNACSRRSRPDRPSWISAISPTSPLLPGARRHWHQPGCCVAPARWRSASASRNRRSRRQACRCDRRAPGETEPGDLGNRPFRFRPDAHPRPKPSPRSAKISATARAASSTRRGGSRSSSAWAARPPT